MTGREIANLLDREGFLTVDQMRIGVRVVNVERNWGSVHMTVAPILGEGEQRVDSKRVKLLPRGVTVAEVMETGGVIGARLSVIH